MMLASLLWYPSEGTRKAFIKENIQTLQESMYELLQEMKKEHDKKIDKGMEALKMELSSLKRGGSGCKVIIIKDMAMNMFFLM